MARGWESKDVESQIEDSRESRRKATAGLSIEEARLAREKEDLLLRRTRVLADLQQAANAGYRDMLHKSLDFLDQRLAELNKPNRLG